MHINDWTPRRRTTHSTCIWTDLHFRIKNSYIRHRLSDLMKWWIKNEWKLVKWRLAAIKGTYAPSGQTRAPRPCARRRLENKNADRRPRLAETHRRRHKPERTNQDKTYLKTWYTSQGCTTTAQGLNTQDGDFSEDLRHSAQTVTSSTIGPHRSSSQRIEASG